MKRITPFLVAVLLIHSCTSTVEDGQPNIIFMLCDDLRWNALGCMGNDYIVTPNIDELARSSVVFQNAYHVSPICLPSRSSIQLGQYLGMHGSGFDKPSNYIVTDDEYASSYPVLLRNAGYYTGFIGKFGFAVGEGAKVVNNNLENRDEYMPIDQFDRWYGFPGQGSYRPLKDGSFNGYDNRWESGHLNEFMGYQAIDFIKESQLSGKPFCLSLSFKAPHAPFDPEKKFRELYNDLEIPRMENDAPEYHSILPRAVREKSRNADWYFGRTGEEREDWHIERDDIYQAFIKNYYGLISGVDDVVGRIRGTLAELDLDKKTVIIFTSDNGFFCGSRQLMGKAMLYDESARAPMIVYDPRIMEDGGRRDETGLISHVDIAPTILDLAGIGKPAQMPGTSFLPLVYNTSDRIHEAVFGENNFDNRLPIAAEVEDPENYISIRSKFVRTEDYKFIRYHECQPVVEELWDMKMDPLETRNLVNDPDYADVVAELRAKLDTFDAEFVKYRN